MSSPIKIIIPALFTIGNLFFGFLSIVKTAEGDYTTAVFCILISAFFDLIDGYAARLLKSPTEFGVQLDSLADITGFGIPVAFLGSNFLFAELGTYSVFAGSIFLIAGAIRLARFNAELKGFEKTTFSGMPIPFASITAAVFVLALIENPEYKIPEITLPVMILLSLLMVSRVKFESSASLLAKSNLIKGIYLIILLFSIVLPIMFGIKVLFAIFVTVILFTILSHFAENFRIKNN